MANLTAISEMVAHTIDSRTKKIADNISNSNILFKQMASHGGSKTYSGGIEIIEEFSYQENKQVQAYRGNELLNTGSNDTMGGAKFQPKYYAVPVVMTGEERLTNSGPEALIDLVASRTRIAEQSLKNKQVRDAYSDGTAEGGRVLTGLAAALSLSPTTGVYGGVSRVDVPVWRNQAFNATASGGTATNKDNILSYFGAMWSKVANGVNTPDLIMVDGNYWRFFQDALNVNARFVTPELGRAGFMTLKYMDADVAMEHSDSGISVNTALFLNTEYFRLRAHADRNYVSLGKRSAVNQDADVQYLVWAGNLTCRGLKYQGIIQN